MKRFFKKVKKTLKNIRYFKKNSIFYRILFAVLFVSIVLCIFNFISLQYIKGIMLSKEVKSQEVYLDYNSAKANNIIEKIGNTVNNIQFDKDTMSLLSNFRRIPQNFQEVKEFERVAQQLSVAKLNNKAIKSIYIYLYKEDIMIESTGTTDGEVYYLNRYGEGFDVWKKEMQKKYWFHFTVLSGLKNNINSSESSDAYILNTLYDTMVPFATLIINLDTNYINSLFLNNEFSKERRVIIINEDKEVISEQPGTTDNDTSFDYSKVYSGSRGSLSTANGFLVQYVKLSTGGLYYIIITPEKNIYRSVMNVFYVSNIVLFGFFILGLAFALYMSQKIYFPISNLVDLLQPMSTYAGNGYLKYNEIDFIKNNLSQVIEGHARMEKIENERAPLIIEALFKKIISGDKDISDMIKVVQELNFEFKKGFYFIAVILESSMRDISEEWQRCDISLKREIGINIKNYFSNNVLSIFRTKENETVIVMHIEDAVYISHIRYSFVDFHRKIFGEKEGLNAYIGIGTQYEDIFGTEKSYKSALAAIEYRSVNETQRVLLGDEETGSSDTEISIPSDMEQRIFNYVTSGNIKTVKEYINSIFYINPEHDISFKSYYDLALLLHNFIMRIVDDIHDGNVKADLQLDTDIEKILEISILKDIVIRNYTAVTMYFLERSSECIFDRILSYIDKNFKNDISLDIIAEEVGMTANYLTRYFKKHKGTNFKSYLNNKRIEAAKQLILTTDKKIREISEYIGYNSPNFFISTFKKLEGITPGEFKKRHTLEKLNHISITCEEKLNS